MNKKIFRSTCLVVFLALAACFVLIMGVLYSYFSSQLVRELQSGAAYLSAAVEEEGEAYLERLDDQSKRITLIDQDGAVLYDNMTDPSAMENHLQREEVKEAMANGVGQSQRLSATCMERTVYYAVRLENGTILRVAGTQHTVLSLVLGILQPILAVVAVALILSGVLSWRLAKKITDPINKIDLEHPLRWDDYEEIRPLLTRIAIQNHTIERQLAQARQKQEEFRIITENMNECILILDHQKKVLTANSAAAQLLNVDEKSGSLGLLEEMELFRSVQEGALSGHRTEVVWPFRGRTYQIIGSPVRQEQAVIGVVILILDETEKANREQLRQEFTANVSHELKTPLTSISGFAELMMNDLVAGEDVKDCSASIYQEAQRLISLVSDIIRLSKLDDGGTLYDEEPVDLCELARDAADHLAEEARRKAVSLVVTGEKAVVYGAEQVLYEVIHNLMENAVKYNVEGGRVDVTVVDGDTVTLTVKDTGIGIPVEQQGRIFERFYRVDKSHSKAIGGTGLGLSIVKHGVEYHSGQIKLDSKPGQGSTFTVTLPKHPRQARE